MHFFFVNMHTTNLHKQHIHFFTEVTAFWTICIYQQLLIICGLFFVIADTFNSLSFSSLFLTAQLFYKIVASNGDINFDTYSILLKNLLSVGSWRKYIEVTYKSNFQFLIFLKLCNNSLHLAIFLSHRNDMMANNPSLKLILWIPDS